MKNKPLLIVFLTVFIDLVGFGMIIPLSPFLAQKFGADPLQVGLLMAVYSGAQFLFSPVWGQISDRIGRRPVILISVFGAGLAHLSFGLATELWILFAARTFAGMFGANISTAMAAIADVTEKADRSKGMGVVGAAFGLGFVLGPALGGFFAEYGFAAPAYGAAGICFANFILAYFIFPETLKAENFQRADQKKAKISRFSRIKRHFDRSEIAPLMIFSFLVAFSLANMEASLFLFVQDKFGWGLRTASFGFAYVGIMMAFTQGYLVRKLLPRFKESKLIFSGAGLFGIGMFLVGISGDIWVLAIGMTLLSIGNGLFNPSVLGLVSQRSAADSQGEVMGVMQSLSALARIFGPPCGGFLYGSVGPSSPFLLASVLSGSVLFWLLSKAGTTKTPIVKITDFLSIGRFQIENILRNSAHTMFVDLQTKAELDSLQSMQGWPQAAWIFKRAESMTKGDLVLRLARPEVDKTAPVVVICHRGGDSRELVGDLETQGFINVYAVSGGALGLLSDSDGN